MSGFLRGHSTATALIKLTDDWRKSLDEKQEVGVVAIDLSKAFDCICHNLLLAKLKAYGLCDSPQTTEIIFTRTKTKGDMQQQLLQLDTYMLWRPPGKSS